MNLSLRELAARFPMVTWESEQCFRVHTQFCHGDLTGALVSGAAVLACDECLADVEPPAVAKSNANGSGNGTVYPISFEALRGLLTGIKELKPDHFKAICPCHDDHHASLRVDYKNGSILMYCDACGANGLRVCESLGIDPKRLRQTLPAVHTNGGNGKRHVIKTTPYEVRDLMGALVAVHNRLDYSDGRKDMPWDRNVSGMVLPLYGSERLSRLDDGATVVVCEGEKAAKSLIDRDINAVGTVVGASRITPDESLKCLTRFRVAFWADNDQVGRAHMQKHHEALATLGCKEIGHVRWPEAPPKGDAADFTGSGEDLIKLVYGAFNNIPALYEDRQPIDAREVWLKIQGESREYALAGLIRYGATAAVSGLMGAGKTTLMLNVVRAWGLGVPVLEREAKQSRTLVVASSKEYDNWAETIGLWEIAGTVFLIESSKAHFGDPQKTAEWFDYWMQKLGCQTFALDTLFDFFGMPPNTAGDENRKAMNEQAPLLSVVRERKYAGIVGGHQPKSEAKSLDPRDAEEAFAGHTGWMAQHRMRVSLRRKSKGFTAIITGRGGYGDAGLLDEMLLRYDSEQRLVSLGGPFSKHLGEAAFEPVTNALNEFGDDGASRLELEKRTGLGRNFVLAGLREGIKRNKVRKTGSGRSIRYYSDESLSDYRPYEDHSTIRKFFDQTDDPLKHAKTSTPKVPVEELDDLDENGISRSR